MAPPSDKYRFRGLAGNATNPNAAFLNSLCNEGPLLISDKHVLASMLKDLPPFAGGGKIFDMRRVFFCVVANMQFSNDLLAVHAGWFPLPLELARIFQALEHAGMPTTAVKDEVALRDVIARWMPKLVPAKRTLDRAKCHVLNVPPSWLGTLTTKYIVGFNDPSTLVHIVCYVPGMWCDAATAGSEYSRALRMLVPVAARSLADDAKADEVVAALHALEATDGRASLARWVPFNSIFLELARRTRATPVERFAPIFDESYATLFPVLARIFPQAHASADSAAIRRMLETLAVGLGVRGSLTQAVVRSVVLAVTPLAPIVDREAASLKLDDDARLARVVALFKEMPGGRHTTARADGADGD